jgi:hypothetical protein
MVKCYTCGTYFHACNSCELSHIWEYDYCSKECWRHSPDYKENKELIEKICMKAGIALKELSEVSEEVLWDMVCLNESDVNE